MRKATFSLVTLALLILCNTASAVNVRLLAHNQRSNSGTLSYLKWSACGPPFIKEDPCLNFANPWTAANVTASTATWDWNAATGVLTSTGFFQTTSFISSNALGNAVISDKVVDLVINTGTSTTTATSYQCIEGKFLATVGAHGCANVSTGFDFFYNGSMAYNVGGAANCIQRTIGGDDSSTGNPRGLTSAAATGVCDAVDGAFNQWTILGVDAIATGGQLVLTNGIDILLPSTSYLTFTAAPDAINDGPFNALQSVPVALNVLANDLVFTDPVTVSITTPPAKGTATVTGTSPGPQAGIRITYTANAGALGADSFVYSVLNSDGTTSDSATVSINILAGGANADTAATTRNHAPININVGANDVGFTDPVTIAITTPPDQGGTATPPVTGPAAGAIVSYTPATTAAGTPTYTETFTYQLTDANLLVATATVTVTVTNTVPVAGDTGISVSTMGSAPGSATAPFNAGSLAGNSLGDAPNGVGATAGAKGTTTVNGNLVTYIPATTFFKGTDTYTYTITDADGEMAMGTVTVTIADVSPVLPDGTITTAAGTASAPRALGITLGNGSLAQHPLTVSTQAANGTCALSGSSVIYTPAAGFTGGDSCVVTVTDEAGAGQSDTGTLTITVTGGSSGGSGGLLPGGGGGAVDPWSLAFLAGVPWLRRLRPARRRHAISDNQG